SSASSTSTEVRYLPCDKPGESPRLVQAREPEHRYTLEHRDGVFYIVTNKDAKNFRLMTAPADDPKSENWQEKIAHRNDVLLERIDLFTDNLVVTESEAGLPRLRVFDLGVGKDYVVELPETVCSVLGDVNPEFNTASYRFRFQSMVTPMSVFDLDLKTGKRMLLKQTEVLGGYNPGDYVTERVSATAQDGAKVPISLVYRKGLKKDGHNPLLLYGYGSYGASQRPTFDTRRLSLLDR